MTGSVMPKMLYNSTSVVQNYSECPIHSGHALRGRAFPSTVPMDARCQAPPENEQDVSAQYAPSVLKFLSDIISFFLITIPTSAGLRNTIFNSTLHLSQIMSLLYDPAISIPAFIFLQTCRPTFKVWQNCQGAPIFCLGNHRVSLQNSLSLLLYPLPT